MSNPFSSPDPSSQNTGPGWSSQQPTTPQNPYQEGPGAGATQGQSAWTASPQGGAPGQYAQQTPPPMDPYAQQAWAQPASGPAWGQPGEVEQIRSNSTIILVLGILGLVVIGPLGSIPAWIWGNSTVKRSQALGLPQNLYQNANIGKILGIIGTILWIIAGILIVAFVVLAIVGATTFDSTNGYTAILSSFA